MPEEPAKPDVVLKAIPDAPPKTAPSPPRQGKTLLSARLPWWKRRKKSLIAGGIVLALVITGLGWFSCEATRKNVDGFVPGWVLEVTVKDHRGQPLEGAMLVLRNRSSRGQGHLWRDEQGRDSTTSGPDGKAVCRDVCGGMWGGTARALFWVIPIEDFSRPEYDCEVTSPGHKPASFRFDALRDSHQRTITDHSVPAVGPVVVRVFDRTVVLKSR